MVEETPKFPRQFYTILRHKWRVDGYDDSGLSDRDIDRLAEGSEHHVESVPFVAGTLGDGSLLRWLQAHKELIQLIFTIGRMILPLLLI